MPVPPKFTSGFISRFIRWAMPCSIVLRCGARLRVGLLTGELLLALVVALLLSGLPGAAAAAGSAKPKLSIGVSIPPQAFFLGIIGGEHLQVSVLLDSGQDPHTYSPDFAQMVELGKARAFFPAGLDIETHWLEKIHSMFPTIEWVADEQLQPDSHFWLAPRAVIRHVSLMRDTLLRLDPDNAADYRKNTEQFLQTLQQLDEQFTMLYSGVGEHNRFMVLHAAWDTFATDYGLHQLVIEEEGKAAGIKHMANLIRVARDLGIDTIFADSAHSNKVALSIARQASGRVVMLNTVSSNWLDDLAASATSIKAALR